jgi:hypothetical protein
MRHPIPRREWLAQAAALAAGPVAFAASAAEANQGWRRNELEVLRAFPKGWLEVLCANDMPDAQGLTGTNRAVGHWLEAGPQRGCCRGVIAAVVAGDLARADQAWKGIDLAFSRQREDGGFEAGVRPNGSSAQSGAAAVETAYFFLQEVGRMLLVARRSSHAAHFEARIEAMLPRLRRACAFIAAGEAGIIEKSSKAVNRIIIAAKAFGTCGRVLRDEALVEVARRLARHALTLRDADGVFIEHGGRDSSYNVVSIYFGQVLALHVDLPEFETALRKATAWQLGRIRPDGDVDVTGNTRTGVGKEPGYDGKPKGVNYNEAIFALAYAGVVHDDDRCMDAARRVFNRTHPGR